MKHTCINTCTHVHPHSMHAMALPGAPSKHTHTVPCSTWHTCIVCIQAPLRARACCSASSAEENGTRLYVSCLTYFEPVPPHLQCQYSVLLGAKAAHTLSLLSHQPYLSSMEASLRQLHTAVFCTGTSASVKGLLLHLLHVPCPQMGLMVKASAAPSAAHASRGSAARHDVAAGDSSAGGTRDLSAGDDGGALKCDSTAAAGGAQGSRGNGSAAWGSQAAASAPGGQRGVGLGDGVDEDMGGERLGEEEQQPASGGVQGRGSEGAHKTSQHSVQRVHPSVQVRPSWGSC